RRGPDGTSAAGAWEPGVTRADDDTRQPGVALMPQEQLRRLWTSIDNFKQDAIGRLEHHLVVGLVWAMGKFRTVPWCLKEQLQTPLGESGRDGIDICLRCCAEREVVHSRPVVVVVGLVDLASKPEAAAALGCYSKHALTIVEGLPA